MLSQVKLSIDIRLPVCRQTQANGILSHCRRHWAQRYSTLQWHTMGSQIQYSEILSLHNGLRDTAPYNDTQWAHRYSTLKYSRYTMGSKIQHPSMTHTQRAQRYSTLQCQCHTMGSEIQHPTMTHNFMYNDRNKSFHLVSGRLNIYFPHQKLPHAYYSIYSIPPYLWHKLQLQSINDKSSVRTCGAEIE